MFDWMKKDSTQPQNNQQNPQQNQQNNQQNQSVAGTPMPGKEGTIPGSNGEPANPLDVYAKMFDTANQQKQDAPPSFNVDPKVLGDVSQNMDFVRNINPELLQKAQQGDTAALLEAINAVGRQAYSSAIHHGSVLTDKFVSARAGYDANQVGGHVRNELTNSALAQTPNYSHPAVKNLLNEQARRIQAANPDASPQEVAQAAAKYIQDIASAITPASASSQGTAGSLPQETDWSSYLN